jgi:hypothetical protein
MRLQRRVDQILGGCLRRIAAIERVPQCGVGQPAMHAVGTQQVAVVGS